MGAGRLPLLRRASEVQARRIADDLEGFATLAVVGRRISRSARSRQSASEEHSIDSRSPRRIRQSIGFVGGLR
jgi:hypothetical protein